MSGDVVVREATSRDVDAIVELFNALITTTTFGYRDAPTTADEQAGWMRERSECGHPTLVADVAGDVIGYACWTSFRGGDQAWSGYRHTVEHSIHIDSRFHRRGIGRLMLNELVERAHASGIHVMVAGIDSTNEPSLQFHRAAGFVEVARMPEVGRKFGRWLDLVLMQRIIE
jgi:phosphinothricin acetyltransferase